MENESHNAPPPGAALDVWQRRGLLDAVTNPDRRLDYVSTLAGGLTTNLPIERASVTVSYVPDILIIPPENFATYLKALSELEWKTLEHLATTILNDVSNELVARWTQVRVDGQGLEELTAHRIVLEERQPQWTNTELLAHLNGR